MIILRNTISEEQKEFSDIKNYKGESNSGMFFIMKVILMYDLDDGKWVDHWIRDAASGIMNSVDKTVLNGFIKNYAVPFLGFSFQSERERYLNTLYRELNTNTPFNYAKDIIKSVQFQSKEGGGVLKYAPKLRNIPDNEVDNIIDQFRYIAMCLNGQIDEEVVNWWDVNPGRDCIDFFSPNNLYSKIDLQRKLFNILKKIEPYLETVEVKFR